MEFLSAAIWQCIRMLGPTVGFLYGSYALQMYVAPSVHPTITSDDPRWIGAWWHGKTEFGHLTRLRTVRRTQRQLLYEETYGELRHVTDISERRKTQSTWSSSHSS